MWEPTEIRRPVGGGNVNLSCRYFQVHVKAEEIRLVGAGEPRRQGFQAEMDTEQQLISDPFLQAERQIWLSEAKEPLGFLNSERRRLDYPIGGLAQPLAKCGRFECRQAGIFEGPRLTVRQDNCPADLQPVGIPVIVMAALQFREVISDDGQLDRSPVS